MVTYVRGKRTRYETCLQRIYNTCIPKFTMICSELDLIGKEIVAIDGSKFRALNSRLKYHSEKKLAEKIKHHTKKSEQYMELLDACDDEEKDTPSLTKDEINNRIFELNELKEQVKQNGTIYETDPDSRMM